MIRCPFEADCPVTCEHPGQMAAHLVEAQRLRAHELQVNMAEPGAARAALEEPTT